MNIRDVLSGGGVGSMPLSFMVGGAFAGAGAVLGIAYFIFGGNPTVMGIVAGGIILVAVLLMAYRGILKMLDKRKANPLSQGISGNAAAAPQGISEPARRARLDDLRRNFEHGVEKFRAAGKNLYSVPWYVLVGEPGSGKTEAIRHCNVGFPPGLQDQLQGAGGTLNMNWWFTNQAIILDTAGRLMFEEVVPGSSNEWMEFLKLLKNNRPNSPVNGLLLVIPVDTLIKDTADQIEKKCTKIAQQFDQIQRTLGVRFPVFVIITKCDLLNGFREFFESLSDPQLQHQIMGWSNPASLDERFDPATVVNHLETVKTRLVERRQVLLLDPVNTEDPQSRRIDQVDALYALPDSITKIGPRLKRYLEMIFVAGEWSPKPLFLRGIYFTSSMTEGAALDAELAEVLGVPVDSLPEGRVFRRDRAYFLRDLFIEKVFREKGLVTRASNADKQQRARRSVVMTFGFAAVIFLFAITWFGAAGLEKNIGGQRNFWHNLSQDDRLPSILDQKGSGADVSYAYNTTKFHNERLGGFFAKNLPPVQAPIQIPAVFRPVAALTGNAVNTQRREEYRNIFESMVLLPVYTAARQKILNATPDTWSPKYTQALAQLMKLEYAAATGKPPAGPDETHRQVDLDPLFAIVLSDDDYSKNFKGDSEGLQQVVDWLYTPAAGGETAWPPKKAPFSLDAGGDLARRAVAAGIADAIGYWNAQASDKNAQLASIVNVQTALHAFRDAEGKLQGGQQHIGKIATFSDYTDFQKLWTEQIKGTDGTKGLMPARDDAAQAWAIASKSKGDTASIVELYKSQKQAAAVDAQTAYDMLLRYTTDAPANTEGPSMSPSMSVEVAARAALTNAEKGLKDWSSDPAAAKTLKDLTDIDSTYLAFITGSDNTQHHRFEAVAHLYEIADKMLVATGAADVTIAPTASLDDAFTKIDKDYADAAQGAGRFALKSTGPDDPVTKAIALTQFMLDASARAKKDLLAKSVLTGLPADAQKWPAAIAALARVTPRDNLQRPQVPLVTFPAGQEKTFDEQFSPDAAGIVSDRLATISRLTSSQDSAGKILDAGDLSAQAAAAAKGFAAYRDQYIAYWRDAVKDQLQFNYSKFADLANKLADSSEAGINGELRAYGDRMAFALNRVGDADDGNAVKLAPSADRDECKEDLSNWLNLGNDPRQVRRAILGMEATNFRENYAFPTAKSNETYIGVYWRRLPVALLRALANDGRAEIEAGLTELKRYERFPLAPAGDKKDDLTLDEVLAARSALERVRGAQESTGGAAATLAMAQAAKPIREGGVTGTRDIDDQLEVLRGTTLDANYRDYLDQLEGFFAGLPADNKPLGVKITVAKDQFKSVDNPITGPFTYMKVIEKDEATGKDRDVLVSTLNIVNGDPDSGTLMFPSGDLTMQFFETPPPTGQMSNPVTIPGRWSVLRLFHDAKPVSHDGNKWTVETDVPYHGRTFALFFTLEFKQPLPEPKDWPVPPAK